MEKSEDKKETFSDSKAWDILAKNYAESAEINTLQANIMLYTQTRSKYGSKIVEVGCGTGVAARAFTLIYMQPGAVYYNSDISQGMIALFESGFKSCELGKIDSIKLTLLETADMHTVEDFDSTTKTKRVFLTIANNEKLPYPDASFDRYISNLSLMLVDNHMNQLNEAYRVLESGGIAGFSVIGREENTQHLAVPQEALKSIGIEPLVFPKNPLHLNDPVKMKWDLESVGFSNVKIYFSPSNLAQTKEEHYEFFSKFGPISAKLKTLTEQQVSEYQEAYYSIFDDKFGPDSTSPVTLEVLIAICKKP